MADTVVGGGAATLAQSLYGSNDGPTNERPLSHGDLLYLRNPEWAPFTALLQRFATSSTLTDPKHYEYTAKDLPRRTTLSGTHNDSTTTINVATGTGKYFRAGTVFVAPRTNEQFLVVSISTDALTVATRPWGTVAAAALVADDPVMIIGQSAMEGADVGAAAAPIIQYDFNYSEIIREPIATTRTERRTMTRPGNKVDQVHPRNVKFALRAVQEQINRGGFFGQPYEDLTGTKPRRFAGGIYDYVANSTASTYSGSAGANLISLTNAKFDPDIFHAIAGKVFNVGSAGLTNRVVFIGPAIQRRLGEMLTNAGYIRSDEERTKKYGFTVKTISTNFGDLSLVMDYALSGSGGPNQTSGDTAWDAYGGYIVCVNFDHFKLKWMDPLTLLRNRQSPGVDGTVDEYLGEFTFERRHAESHCVVKGFVG